MKLIHIINVDYETCWLNYQGTEIYVGFRKIFETDNDRRNFLLNCLKRMNTQWTKESCYVDILYIIYFTYQISSWNIESNICRYIRLTTSLPCTNFKVVTYTNNPGFKCWGMKILEGIQLGYEIFENLFVGG